MGDLDHKIHTYCGDKSGKVCNLKFIETLFSPLRFFDVVIILNWIFFSTCSSLKLGTVIFLRVCLVWG
jgi:hypothetical protein